MSNAGFTRVAIVNRGEAAVRLIRAVRELNLEHGWGITTIALHTEAERRAMFVLEADEAVLIGGGKSPYLDHGELERVLCESRADAAWVGWEPLATVGEVEPAEVAVEGVACPASGSLFVYF